MNEKLAELQENKISSVNQNEKNVYFYGNGKGFKLMFVGNSITKHRPLGSWKNDCGMAASSIDRDYVHLLVKKFENALKEEISFSICQIANYERTLDLETLKTGYSDAKGYNPDIVIMFFGANVPRTEAVGNIRYTDAETLEKFGPAYEAVRNFVCGENTLVFHSDGFYIRPDLDEEKKKICKKYKDTYINLEDIRSREDTHGGYNHPGDVGMAAIAERFWSVIEERLEKNHG